MFSSRKDSVVNKMKLCAFCGSQMPDDPKYKNKSIEKQLRLWKKQDDRVVKLLLLGIGESGKSTLTKQMRIIHTGDFTESERLEKVPDIRQNVRDAIQSIIGAMNNMGLETTLDSEVEKSAEYIKSLTKEIPTHSAEFYEHVTRLWSDQAVLDCYLRSNEYQLFDSAKYFLDRIDIIRDDAYVPSDQDLLRCRIMTNTIQRIDFQAMDDKTAVNFSVYDVGGQQGERRKWIQVFDMVTAVLFVVDCSCFDLTLREDHSRNRFLEAMEIFEQVWNNRFLRQTPVVLFLNKIDLLEEKILQGRRLEDLIDSLEPNHHYYNLLQTFHEYTKPGSKSGPKDEERQEFIESFPRYDPAKTSSSSHKPDQSKSKESRKKSYRDDMDERVIRTAVFIKRIFMNLVQNPTHEPERRRDWHQKNDCVFYFTCAVDTQTIRKVLEGCRSLIIRKVLDKWGM